MWWRVFVPSWRFFDHAGPAPRLLVRTDGEDWMEPLEPPRVRWRHLLINPEGGLNHARANLLHRLVEEVAAAEAPVEELVSFRLLEGIVKENLLARGLVYPGTRFDFKITCDGEDVLLGYAREV